MHHTHEHMMAAAVGGGGGGRKLHTLQKVSIS